MRLGRTVPLLLLVAALAAAAWTALDPRAQVLDPPAARRSEEGGGAARGLGDDSGARTGGTTPSLTGWAGSKPAAQLPQRHAPVSGTVRHPDGRPAAGARVVAAGLGTGLRPLATTTSGRDGAYRLERASGRNAWILASLEDGCEVVQGASIALDDQRTVDVTLDRRAELLEIVVRDPDGALVPYARLSARIGGRARDVGPVVAGRARIPVGSTPFDSGLPLAKGVWLEVYDARSASDGAPLPLSSGEVGPLPERIAPVEIRLEAGALVRAEVVAPAELDLGQITYAIGLLAEDAPQAAEEDSPLPTTGRIVEGSVRSDGGIEIAALHPRRPHVLELKVDPQQVLPVPRRIVTPGDPPQRIELRPAVAAEVLVLDPQGRPVSGASARAVLDGRAEYSGGQSSRGASAFTSPEGTARLVGLDPRRRYELRADPPSRMGARAPGAPALQPWLPVVHGAWTPGPTTLRLRQGYFIAGRVRDAAGRPAPEVAVLLDMSEHTTSDAQGAFRFGPLEPGVHHVVALLSHGGTAAALDATRDVLAGQLDVLLGVPALRGLEIPLPERMRQAAEGTRFLRATFSLRWHDGSDWVAVTAPKALDVRADDVALSGLVLGARYEVLCVTGEPDYLRAEIVPEALEAEFVATPGGVIRGRVEGAPPGHAIRVHWISHVSHGTLELAADGPFEIQGLPDDSYVLHAKVPTSSLEARLEARPGDVVRLELEAGRPGRFGVSR